MHLDPHLESGADQLNNVFHALADPTRRGMLEQLSTGETHISALAAPYEMSQPAVSKHLKVLEKAGLIRREKRGREHHIHVETGPVDAAQHWISYYSQFWKARFDAVDAYLAKKKETKG